jgi:hypothetical protein
VANPFAVEFSDDETKTTSRPSPMPSAQAGDAREKEVNEKMSFHRDLGSDAQTAARGPEGHPYKTNCRFFVGCSSHPLSG